jgi:hypothetical protein
VGAAPEPVVLTLAPHQARDLPRTIPHLVGDVRRRLLRHSGSPPAVTIDLSAVPPTPACAPLLLLFRLVRRLTDPPAEVVVTGASPALATCLVADLPAGTTVTDRRGRRWPS